jgi:ectoine hydroxylase-related dioxygenase (phytanoyl-CoA dioxygenase family)
VTLSSTAVAEFFEAGFLCVESLTSADEVTALRAIYDRLFLERAGESEGLYTEAPSDGSIDNDVPFPKIHRIFDLAPELRASGFMSNATRIAEQLYGDQIRFLGGRAMMKPPFCSQQTPWHQDPAYHRPDRIYRNVNFWLALQDCPVEAGAMHFVPGSHKGSVIFSHCRPRNRIEANGLELSDTTVITNVVACPLLSGGAALHHSYVLHHTPPNTTPTPRRALIAVFGAPTVARAQPLELPWQLYAPARDPGT